LKHVDSIRTHLTNQNRYCSSQINKSVQHFTCEAL
jgi:hypothetical protein